MIGLLKILALYLFVMLFTNNISKAQETPQVRETPPPRTAIEINNFNRRLERIYDQSNQDTYGQQVVYGSIEALSVWKLNTLIPPRDKVAIQSIQRQLTALQDKPGNQIYGVEQISEQERKARISSLNRKLKTIEGNLGQRLGRGTTKFFVRGAQLFLVAQVASRIYVLTALDARDPGFFPLPSFVCSGVDCDYAVDQVMDRSNRAYQRSRQTPTVTPTPVPAPVSPAPTQQAAPSVPPAQEQQNQN